MQIQKINENGKDKKLGKYQEEINKNIEKNEPINHNKEIHDGIFSKYDNLEWFLMEKYTEWINRYH